MPERGKYRAGRRTSPPPEHQPGKHEPESGSPLTEAAETIVTHHLFWTIRGLAERIDRLNHTGDHKPGTLEPVAERLGHLASELPYVDSRTYHEAIDVLSSPEHNPSVRMPDQTGE